MTAYLEAIALLLKAARQLAELTAGSSIANTAKELVQEVESLSKADLPEDSQTQGRTNALQNLARSAIELSELPGLRRTAIRQIDGAVRAIKINGQFPAPVISQLPLEVQIRLGKLTTRNFVVDELPSPAGASIGNELAASSDLPGESKHKPREAPPPPNESDN